MEIQTLKRRISPRQKQRREQIIACTRALIGTQGSTFSMEAVADTSGTSRSTLYRYFSSREHLIAEVTLDVGYRLIDLLQQEAADATVGERVTKLCNQVSLIAESNMNLLATCVSNIASEDPAVIDAQKEIEQLVSGMFRSTIGDIKLPGSPKVEETIFRYLLGAFILATSGKLGFDDIAADLTSLCHRLMKDIWDIPIQ